MNQEERIWRYMDFTKFVAMLENGGLFFSRLDCLGDPFEGSWPDVSIEGIKTLMDALVKDVSSRMPPALEQLYSLGDSEQVRGHIIKLHRQYILVSCWYLSQHESAAMWELFSRGEEGVAICSTTEKIQQLSPKVRAEAVKYIDFSEYEMPIPKPGSNPAMAFAEALRNRCFYKREAFEHEKEFRAVLYRDPIIPENPFEQMHVESKPGYYLQCNLSEFLECVLVSHRSADWFLELVQSVLRTKSVQVGVARSGLSKNPRFY